MSEVKVNKISPRTNCGTVQLGDSGDTITIPAGATITNNGTQTGFGRTGTVDWDTTAKTTSFTAVSGDGYFVNTTSGAITATLPAGSPGSIVSFKDYASTWQTNNLTIAPNGTDKINGTAANATLNTEDQSVTLVYVDDTKGWRAVQDSTSDVTGQNSIVATGGTITTCGNCKIHTFTGPGTFCVSQIANTPANNQVSYLVVAGGGSGGKDNAGGGGGGGFREDKSPLTPYTSSPLEGAGAISVTATGFPITVGGGGAAITSAGNGNNGSNSVFSTITSTGGGGGGGYNNPGAPTGGTGGSGGGGAISTDNQIGCSPGAAGNTPPVSPPQGNPGGKGYYTASGNAAGGGGGAGGTGGDSTTPSGPGNRGGIGGVGVPTSISGSATAYAGGGGGGGGANCTGGGCSPCGTGGYGGTNPGNGSNPTRNAPAPSPDGEGRSGTTNRGGGGGGVNGDPTSGVVDLV